MGQLDAPVELRAFRGTRRTSTYREHTLSEGAFGRILAMGAERGLAELSALDLHRRHELDKAGAQRLAEEATEVRMSGRLPDSMATSLPSSRSRAGACTPPRTRG